LIYQKDLIQVKVMKIRKKVGCLFNFNLFEKFTVY
jgi:hypothetical protein